MKSTGTLYVVGTPIGNLQDLSPRARAVLSDVQLIAAEDTRRTRGLLSTIGANTPLISYHEHNEARRAPQLIERLLAGDCVALVSDAGTPLVSDPGYTLVREAVAAGVAVVSVPGASALIAALSVCGLPIDRFAFEGFLPRRASARAARLQELAEESRTMAFYESVHRLEESLDALADALGGDRPAALARELTKLHEQVCRGTLASLRAGLGGEIPLKGEFVIVVAGAPAGGPSGEGEARRVYALLSAELSPRKAVALTAEITGMSRNAVYRLTRIPEP